MQTQPTNPQLIIAPNLDYASPSIGYANESITIVGSKLYNIVSIVFGNVEYTILDKYESYISGIIVPDGTGTVAIYGKSQYGNTNTIEFTYQTPPPTITSITPETGVPGSAITITGTNLQNITLVNIGFYEIFISGNTNSTRLTVNTWPIGRGIVTITVKDSQGRESNGKLFTYETPATPVPTITNINPETGVPGSAITITGTNLQYVNLIKIGTYETLISGNTNSTSLTGYTSPIGSGYATITVKDLQGSESNSILFTYEIPETIDMIVPILDSMNNLYTVGINDRGQSGDGTTTYQNELHLLTDNVTYAEATRYGMMYLKGGSLYACGTNQYGELGNIYYISNSLIPIYTRLTKIYLFSAGIDHTLIIDNYRQVITTGLNNYGQLGLGNTDAYTSPKYITHLNSEFYETEQVSTGLSHSAILTRDGAAYTFGRNQYGQLGNNTTTDEYNPFLIKTNVTQLACGFNHTLFLIQDKVYACGLNSSTQLGFTGYSIEPRQVPRLNQIVYISARGNRSAALDILGNLWVWGEDYGFPSIQKTQVSSVNVTYMGIFYVSNNEYKVLYSKVPSLPVGPILFGSPAVPLFSIQSNICFPANTPVTTDQGDVSIQLLAPGKHTIRGKSIVAITETYSTEPDLIVLEKDALFLNSPSQRTVITKEHCIFYQGAWVEAYKFLKPGHTKNEKDPPNIYTISYTGEPLYNVLLEEHGRMKVNNMIVETLDPNNTIGKIFKKYQEELQEELQKD